MKLDAAAVGLASVTAITVILHLYACFLQSLENYNLRAWVLAEELADALVRGERVKLRWAEARVTIWSLKDVKSYAMGGVLVCRGYAYTFRILPNATLLRVEVEIEHPEASIETVKSPKPQSS